VASAGSVLGGMVGYGIGYLSSDLAHALVEALGHADQVAVLQAKFGENAFLAIFAAGFTPIPYKVFTITAGLCHEMVSLPVFLAASALSRPLRFFSVAIILYFFGPPARRFLERYFNALTLIFLVLLIAGFVFLKPLLSGS
jgi:membrane protein YqaA with SNARE-associated domain